MLTTKGAIGHIRGLRADDQTWEIREIAIETGPWYARRKQILLPASIIEIDHTKRTVTIKPAGA